MSRGPRPTTIVHGVVLALVAVGVASVPVAAAASPTDSTDPAPDTFEVIVSDEVAPGEPPAFEVIETDRHGLAEILDRAGAHDRIELNGAASLTWTPPDPDFPRQWGHRLGRLERAWDVTTGDDDITIAVLDTGVSPHPDLGGRLLPGTSMVDGDPHDDPVGHGTSVALVAAAGHDGTGTAGVCPGCSILPVQVAAATGSVPWSAAAEGIVWAVDHGADVINISFGGSAAPTIVEEAVAYAVANGVVVVGSAGNDGHTAPFYPAAYDDVIAVGAHDEASARYPWGNHGPWVDVAAPGCAVEPDRVVCGTSYAAPWISGIVGLLRSAVGPLDAAATEAIVEGATIPLTWVETGRVDAGTAIGSRFMDIGFVDTGFVDIAPHAYYAEPVAWMVANHLTTGTSPTTYSPDTPVTRGQLAAFLWRLDGTPAT